jgi:hypothetical protein
MLLPQAAQRTFSICMMVAILCGGSALVLAQKAAVPVMYGVDAEFETCGWGQISKATTVRSGPGTGYSKTGDLKAGAGVTMFGDKGDWIGIAYGSESMVDCPPRKTDKAYDGPGKSGWVLKKHVRLVAG